MKTDQTAFSPLISIITPSYNSGPFLPQAIESVIAQNYPQVEHLIIDGGSTDNTLTVLQRYQRHVTWLSEADNGQADALNKGFQRAQGEIIGWLNADDSYQPQAFWQVARYLQQHPEVSLVYGHFNFIDERDHIFYTHRVPTFSLEKLLYGNIIPNASMFFRREILAELGGVNLTLHYVMDWEFVWRIAQRYQVQRFPAIWGNFRIMPGTKSVEHTDHFWPEIIPTLEIVSQIAALQPHRDSALFWAYVLAALEFARADNLNATQQYWQQAIKYYQQSPYKVSNLIRADSIAFALAETALRPWHRGFREHPHAAMTLANLQQCLGNSPFEQQLTTQLTHYQQPHLCDNLGELRFNLYSLLGNDLLLRLRSLKNRLGIAWDGV